MGRRTTLAVAISSDFSPSVSGVISALEEEQEESAARIRGIDPSIEGGIWLDMVIRENARIKVGDYVKVRRKKPYDSMYLATQFSAMPFKEELQVDGRTLANWLHGVPVTNGDLVFYYDRAPESKELKGALYKVTKLAPKQAEWLLIHRYTNIAFSRY